MNSIAFLAILISDRIPFQAKLTYHTFNHSILTWFCLYMLIVSILYSLPSYQSIIAGSTYIVLHNRTLNKKKTNKKHHTHDLCMGGCMYV